MKILWITNQPIAYHREMLNIPLGQSGGWMEVAYESIKDSAEIELCVTTVHEGKQILHKTVGKHQFYIIPSPGGISNYDVNSSNNIQQWSIVINEFNPDIIHLWGTEYAAGLCAIKANPNIPSVVYIQGVMAQIYYHMMDGISRYDEMKYSGIREILRNNIHWVNRKWYQKCIDVEKEILQRAQNIIVENKWCEAQCQVISGGCKAYYSKLPINNIFAGRDWSWDNMEPHSIFTVAGGYPIKGHHFLLQALAIVKESFPDVKLLIPGNYSYLTDTGFLGNPYGKFISDLIRKYDLSNNLVFLGRLTPDQMMENLLKSNVFVCSSVLENHSSSLLEAMMSGVPTISSFVGGIDSYYHSEHNGVFYRSNDVATLAFYITKVFSDRKFAEHIAENGKNSTRKERNAINIKEDFLKIYKEIINE